MFVRIIDAISDLAGKLCAWGLFAVGFFIMYEIIARYVFTAPTIWVDEVSRIIQIWAVYLAAAYVLKNREMVTIEVLFRDHSTLRRRIAESIGLIVMMGFAGVAVYYGFQMWLKEALAGHTTDTYLAPPKWLTQAPVWVGCVLLALQGVAEFIRIWTQGIPEDDILDGQH